MSICWLEETDLPIFTFTNKQNAAFWSRFCLFMIYKVPLQSWLIMLIKLSNQWWSSKEAFSWLTTWASTIIRVRSPKADSMFRHCVLALSAGFSGSTYIFSKERFLLLWILPFLLRFLLHAFKEQGRLRSGRKLPISIQTNPKTVSVSERQEGAEGLVLSIVKWCKAATPK